MFTPQRVDWSRFLNFLGGSGFVFFVFVFGLGFWFGESVGGLLFGVLARESVGGLLFGFGLGFSKGVGWGFVVWGLVWGFSKGVGWGFGVWGLARESVGFF